jgi:recombinational DNA repair ATPase RecF
MNILERFKSWQGKRIAELEQELKEERVERAEEIDRLVASHAHEMNELRRELVEGLSDMLTTLNQISPESDDVSP